MARGTRGSHRNRHAQRNHPYPTDAIPSGCPEGAKQCLNGLLEISGVQAGLQAAGWLSGGIDGELAAAAAKRDVEVIPLSRYSRGGMAREALQLGFAAVGVSDLAIAELRTFHSSGSRAHRR